MRDYVDTHPYTVANPITLHIRMNMSLVFAQPVTGDVGGVLLGISISSPALASTPCSRQSKT